MAQKKLEAEIVLKGKADESLKELSGILNGISTAVSGISGKARDVLEDSLDYYKDYQKNMLDARAALSAQYDSYAELSRVMTDLDVNAQKWAASSIFHTSDISQAISEAAHAGWSYEEMISGIPAAMQLAQAGGYELSTALDQVIKVTNASGSTFEDIGANIDMWTLAANLGATSISEMGEALTKMGSTVQFAGGMDQAFTMLTLLANMGTTGSEAGTLLRNTMLRLVAPTEKASDAMAGLMVTDDEMAEIAADASTLEEANKQLQAYGFSVYDEKGQLKDMTTIFSDLATVVEGMSDQERNTLLSAIFPTRTITGAMNLLKSIENGSWTEVLSQLADAKGYAEDVGDIMNSSYANQIELFTSKIEALETKIGSFTAPNIESIMSVIGGVLDKINGLDNTSMAAITGALEGLAAVGPITAGTAAIGMLISKLDTKMLVILGAAAGVTALAAGIGALAEASNQDFKSNFGNMELDITELNKFVQGIRTEFTSGLDSISGAYDGLTTALTDYQNGVSSFMSGIDTAAITGKALSPTEISALTAYGTSIGNAVLEGINSASTITLNTLNLAYSDENGEVPVEDWGIYSSLWAKIEGLYSGLNEHAADVGQRLGKAISSAMEDGTISLDEQKIISSIMAEYDEIERQIAEMTSQKQLYSLIESASRVSWDSFADFAALFNGTYDDEVQRVNDAMDGLQAATRMAIEADLGRKLTDDEWLNNETRLANEEKRADQLAAVDQKFYSPMMTALDLLMGSSGAGDAWQIMRDMEKAGYGPEAFADPGMWSQFSDVPITDLNNQFGILNDAFLRLQTIAPGLMDGAMMQGYQDNVRGMMERSKIAKDIFLQSGLSSSAFAAQYNPNGTKVTVPVSADTSQADQQINALSNKTISVSVSLSNLPSGKMSRIMRGYATGGRATEASIFGEAGAEWAIPEQHSERTADLLDSARKASGFSWGELIARTGGLNAKSESSGATFIYSPTINANDSTGVEDVLNRNKDAMLRWWRRMQTKDSMEVYA